jgi:carbamate kinase
VFAAGSMGPKVEAAVAFAVEAGKPAAIGRLEDATEIVAGRKGTRIALPAFQPSPRRKSAPIGTTIA